MNINFDSEEHIYYRDDNVIVPSVTTILQDVGIIDTQYYTEQGKFRGSYVHTATQYLDEGHLDKSSLDPILIPYLEAYEKFKRETGFKPKLIEQIVYNEGRGYAGIFDRLGVWPGVGYVLLDIKSGFVPRWVRLQLAAYVKATKSQYDSIFSLQLKGNGRYDCIEYKNTEDDYLQFLYALKTYQYKHQEVMYYAQEKP